MNDGLLYLMSNQAAGASVAGAFVDLKTAHGSPLRGNDISIRPGTIVNSGTVTGTVDVLIKQSSDTTGTDWVNNTILTQAFFSVGAGTTVTPNELTKSLCADSEFVQAIVIPSANVTVTGMTIQVTDGKYLK
jgi:hypothetical protein